jgi:hypothetical protein
VTNDSTAQAAYSGRGELHWSPAEKIVARRAFKLALQRELDDLIRETKKRAAMVAEPSQLWELEDYLTKRRREIDEKYDYRYSVLTLVFARLLYEGRMNKEDLRGLGQDKLDLILRIASP